MAYLLLCLQLFILLPSAHCQNPRNFRIGVIQVPTNTSSRDVCMSIMYNTNTDPQSDPFLRVVNGDLEGYMVDLVSEVANLSNFSYELVQSVDNRYGIDSLSGTWNGKCVDNH